MKRHSLTLSSQQCNAGPFELPDSTEHNLTSYPFTIRYMQLWIEPDFESRTIDCEH